jgi:hypothetical protein
LDRPITGLLGHAGRIAGVDRAEAEHAGHDGSVFPQYLDRSFAPLPRVRSTERADAQRPGVGLDTRNEQRNLVQVRGNDDGRGAVARTDINKQVALGVFARRQAQRATHLLGDVIADRAFLAGWAGQRDQVGQQFVGGGRAISVHGDIKNGPKRFFASARPQ